MASALARRYFPGASEEQKPPSLYTQQHNKDVADALAAQRKAVLENEKKRIEIAENAQRARENHLKINQQALENAQEATLFKQKITMLNQAMENEFIRKLAAIPSDRIESKERAMLLGAQYPVSKFSDAAQNSVKLWNDNFKFATEREVAMKEAAEIAKKAKEETEKNRVAATKAALIEKHRTAFDNAQANLIKAHAQAEAFRADPAQRGKPMPLYVTGNIKGNEELVQKAGARLIKEDPSQAQDVSDAMKESAGKQQQYLLRLHDELQGLLPADINEKGWKPAVDKLNAVKAELGPSWGQIAQGTDPNTKKPIGVIRYPSAAQVAIGEVAKPPASATGETSVPVNTPSKPAVEPAAPVEAPEITPPVVAQTTPQAAAPETEEAIPRVPALNPIPDDILTSARAAITSGKHPDAVRQRLKDNGYDPSGL